MDRHGGGSGGAAAFLAVRAAEGGRGQGVGEANEASALGALLDGFGGMFEVPLDRLRPDPSQPRKDFGERDLGELAENMMLLGQLQPAVVRPVDGEPGHYMLVMGERRWRAAALAGLPTLQCILRHEDARLIPAKQWAENHFRAELSPIEEAGAIKSVMELEQLDVAAFAARYGLSERSVRRYLQLLSAPGWIQAAVIKGEQVQTRDGVTEVRKLDLTGAVELQRIYNTYVRQEQVKVEDGEGGGKPGSKAFAAAAKKAQQRAETVKKRALTENWSRRRWQSVAAAAAMPAEKVAERRVEPAPDNVDRGPLYEVDERKFVVHLMRISTGTAAERNDLAARLLDLLAQIRNATPAEVSPLIAPV